ncbi:hypothetical protein VHEMI04876 [[Torrubiella] hemipterigena]|nr:hypothetical protein VHEMI04876 [[Torrubiella] hemipterigena]
MIKDFGIHQDDVGKWAGIISAAFSFSQSATGVPWGYVSDRLGRKPILITGLCINMVCFVAWGMATSLTMAIIVRCIQGASAGNVGIIRTMVAEMVPQKELQPIAFSLMPIIWSLGSVVGPAFGGFFARPAEQFPDIFGNIQFFKTFPYALPNLLAMVMFTISVTSATLFLKETLAEKRGAKDWGLLVGQKLTNAFSRKRTSNRRRSFVDGEATAPLVPTRPLPRGAKGGMPSNADVFNRQTVINLVSYSILAFHSVAYDQNVNVLMDYEVKDPSEFKLPFYFDTGFGMDSGQIGTVFAIYGIACSLIQFILYPPLVARFGVLRCFRICCMILPFVYMITPYTALFPTERGRVAAIIVVMVFKAFGIIVAFPSTTILLTNSCSSLKVLGTLNGYATMFSGIARGLGPATTGLIFTWGAKRGYVVLPYYYLALFAATGAFVSFMIEDENNLATASDESDSDAVDDSATLLQDESAVASESEDEDDSTKPLLNRKQPNTQYQAISGTSK